MTSDDTRRNVLHVKTINDDDAIGAGIYLLHPDGHPEMPGEGAVAEFLAGVQFEPEQCYEIARTFTLCAIRVEEKRKRKGAQ